MVSFTHEQNIICSKTKVDDIEHEKTIICRKLFAGHVVGSQPMKRKKTSFATIDNCIGWTPGVLTIFTNQILCLKI